MTLSDALKRAAEDTKQRCKVQLFVDGLPVEEQEAFNQALQLIREQREIRGVAYAKGYTAPWLLRLVEKELGHRIPIQGLQRHIAGDCMCGRV